jgi:hypothetical protein
MAIDQSKQLAPVREMRIGVEQHGKVGEVEVDAPKLAPAGAALTSPCRGARCLVPFATQRVSGRPAGSASRRPCWHAT